MIVGRKDNLPPQPPVAQGEHDHCMSSATPGEGADLMDKTEPHVNQQEFRR